MPVILEMSVSEQLAEAESEDGEVPDTRQIQRWANAASEGEQESIVSVQIVSAGEMQSLNSTWRGKDNATNVLNKKKKLEKKGFNVLLFRDGRLIAESEVDYE